MVEACRLLLDRDIHFGLLIVVFSRRVEPDATTLRSRSPNVPVSHITQATVTVKEGVETRSVGIRRRIVREAAEVGRALYVRLRVEPVGSIHVKLLDLLLAAAGSRGDTVLGNPNGEVEAVANGSDVAF